MCVIALKITLSLKIMFFNSWKSCPNWKCCKLSASNFFPFSLTFFHQLILQEGIFGMAASLIFFILFAIKYTLQQLLFQRTYSLSFWWLLIAQTQYQDMVEGWKEITRQKKDHRSSQKLRKLVAWKKYLTQKVAIPDLVSITN